MEPQEGDGGSSNKTWMQTLKMVVHSVPILELLLLPVLRWSHIFNLKTPADVLDIWGMHMRTCDSKHQCFEISNTSAARASDLKSLEQDPRMKPALDDQ